ncbi:MAG TPA: hypothetical protein OIM45_08575 [Clostridiaceae bacterium]|nr:hypothetical protein [Clostridiaceae bacterium]
MGNCCNCGNSEILWFIILFLLLFCSCGNNSCCDNNCGCGC